MFNPFKMLRALCPPKLAPLPFTGYPPASASPDYNGACRRSDLPQLGPRKFWLAPLALLLVCSLSAPAHAFPPIDEFVGQVADTYQQQLDEVCRAAYHAVHGSSDGYADGTAGPSISDRVDVSPLIKTKLQRKRLVDFILHEPRYARLVYEAHIGPLGVMVPAN